MSKLKLHALRPLPYETSINWTLCQRHVERSQIAAFEAGVTCKQCRAIIDFNEEREKERRERQAKEANK